MQRLRSGKKPKWSLWATLKDLDFQWATRPCVICLPNSLIILQHLTFSTALSPCWPLQPLHPLLFFKTPGLLQPETSDLLFLLCESSSTICTWLKLSYPTSHDSFSWLVGEKIPSHPILNCFPYFIFFQNTHYHLPYTFNSLFLLLVSSTKINL